HTTPPAPEQPRRERESPPPPAPPAPPTKEEEPEMIVPKGQPIDLRRLSQEDRDRFTAVLLDAAAGGPRLTGARVQEIARTECRWELADHAARRYAQKVNAEMAANGADRPPESQAENRTRPAAEEWDE